MSLRDELQAIYDTYGRLTPSIVLAQARTEDHPLHDRFEWDDAVAGEAWRLSQAHELIRSVRISYRKPGKSNESVRAFHAVPREDGWAYEPAEKVADDPFLRELVLRDMERQWKQLQERYQHFSEFVEMVRRDIVAA
jgi:hypothetical protein